MRLKLDENLGERAAARLRRDGHDVTTVHQQGLAGCADPDLIDLAVRKARCSVTLDIGFAIVQKARAREQQSADGAAPDR